MENNNTKSLYLALFILSVVNAVFSTLFVTFSFGFFIDIAVFILILIILRPKLPKEKPMPSGIKLLLISCIIHFVTVVLLSISSLLNYIISLEIGRDSSNLIFLPANLIGILLTIVSIVLLIISSVKVYKEYNSIN
ncbi:hypothetical protein [Sebaldella sp. S0638]|uniref:hypothetical protein n=1 Tax=Sebaldella sp. S0638 TaxID=2957809 RepID=UPI0020A0AA2B|nr:hypothetical protein [Sebaldella sp. S0638]MCP1224406.1 hypothetical protein [Sebaldella sp. S0638]